MSTPSKELIAVAHIALLPNEAALKQLATIFHRICFPESLWVALRPDPGRVLPQGFLESRCMLIYLGILYELDMKNWQAADSAAENSLFSLFDDMNELLSPFGFTVEEMFAARNDPEEMKRIRKLSELPDAAKVPDYEQVIKTERRFSVNTTRMCAIQVRNGGQSDAYATIPSGDSSLDDDDPRPNKHDVLKIAVVVPVPHEQTSWQQIIEYRGDSDSQGRFFELKEWMTDITRGTIAKAEAQKKIEFLLDQYRRVLERHEIQIDWTKLEAFVVTGADDSPFQTDQHASPLFSVQPRKLALLESESTLPGSVVAFVTQAKAKLGVLEP